MMRALKVMKKIRKLIAHVVALAMITSLFITPGLFAPQLASAAAYYSIDSSLLVPKNVSASEMDEFIRSVHPESQLIGHSQMWINAQNKYGIDAVYLMAHAMCESRWGTDFIAPYNMYGYGAYDRDPETGAARYPFTSYEDCADKVAGFIFEDYLSPSGDYYTDHGPTLRGMNVYYATAGHWGQTICNIMNEYYSMFPFQAQSPPDAFWSRAFVKQLYRNALRREADINEASAQTNAITQNYWSRRLMALNVLDSAEGNGAFVRYSLYQNVLGRNPWSIPLDDVNSYVNRLAAGTSERDLTAKFYASDEYYSGEGGSSASSFIAALYLDILGRSATSEEITPWAKALGSGSTRTDVAYAILSAPEAFARFIAAQYNDKLGRGGSLQEVAAWVNLMVGSYPMSERQVKYNFLSGDEFTYTGLKRYIDSLYLNALGRGSDPAGYWASYSALVQGVSRYNLAASFVNSTEAHIGFVSKEYLTVLGRGSDPGMMGWVGLMDRGTSGRQVTAFLYGSGEYYYLHGSTPEDFIVSLYTKIIGRGTNPGEVAQWANALRAGMPREQAAAQFLTSWEYQSTNVRVLYRTNLRRDPTAGELAVWIGGFTSGWTEEQFKIAVLSSDEYAIQNL